VGPVGLEPTTNGLKDCRRWLRLVSSRVFPWGETRQIGRSVVRLVSFCVLPLPPVRLQIGLHF